MRQKNICLLTFSDKKKKGIEYHEISFNGKTAYFEKNKEGLIQVNTQEDSNDTKAPDSAR